MAYSPFKFFYSTILQDYARKSPFLLQEKILQEKCPAVFLQERSLFIARSCIIALARWFLLEVDVTESGMSINKIV